MTAKTPDTPRRSPAVWFKLLLSGAGIAIGVAVYFILIKGANSPTNERIVKVVSITTLKCDYDEGVSLALSGDGTTLVTQGFGKNKSVQVWDMISQEKRIEIAQEEPGPVAITFDGKKAVLSDWSGLSVRDTSTGKELAKIQTVRINSLKLSKNEDFIVAIAHGGVRALEICGGTEHRLWNYVNNNRIAELASCLSDFFDGTKIAAARNKNEIDKVEAGATISIFDIDADSKTPHREIFHAESGVAALAISSDGMLLAAAANPFGSFGIKVWKTESGELFSTIGREKLPFGIASLAFLPNSWTLVYQAKELEGSGPRLALTDLKTGSTQFQLVSDAISNSNNGKVYVTSLSVSRNGSILAIGCSNGAVCIDRIQTK